MAFVRFQWLKDYQCLDEQILYLKWNLNKSRLELDRWVNGDLANVRLEKNSRSSSVEESIEAMKQEITILEKQREEMKALVKSFKGIDQEIIRLKYIDGYSLECIAEKTGYSESYIRKKHADIRNTLSFLDQYEANQPANNRKRNEIEYYNEQRSREKQISLF